MSDPQRLERQLFLPGFDEEYRRQSEMDEIMRTLRVMTKKEITKQISESGIAEVADELRQLYALISQDLSELRRVYEQTEHGQDPADWWKRPKNEDDEHPF